MAGWISLHRKVRDHWLFAEKRSFSKFEAWVDLLMEVNHQDKKFLLGNELAEVKRGQTITSIRQLCDRWGWSNTKVKQFLTLLQNDGMLTYKSDTKKTVITIANYEHFQSISDEKTTQNTHGNVTKQTQKHTNNNDNNDNNENKTISTTTIEPEYGELITIFENNIGMIAGTINEEAYYEFYQLLGKDLVIHAIRKATERNKRSFGYVKSILNSWIKAKCKTVADADAFDQQHFNQNKNGVNRVGKPTGNTKKYDFSNITVNTRE